MNSSSNDINPKPKKKWVKKQSALFQKTTQQKNQLIKQKEDNFINKIKTYIQKCEEQISKKQSHNQSSYPKIAYEASKIPDAPTFVQKGKKTGKKYVNYEDQGNILQIRDIIQESDSRKLKKCLKQTDSNADKIVLKYQINKPVVMLQYQINQRRQLLHIRDLMNANQNLKKNRDLIIRIYSSLYKKVEQKHYEIGRFAIQIANQKRIRFRDRNFSIKSVSSKINEYPIYFAIKRDQINFLMFDSALNSVEFNTDSILNLQKKFEEEFAVYKEFERIQHKNDRIQQIIAQNFGQEEVDSDEQSRRKKIEKQKDLTIAQLRNKINIIIKKDISEYEDKIQTKNQQVNLMAKNGVIDGNQLMAKLADQVMEEQSSLDNFTQTRDYVLAKISADFSSQQQQCKILKSCLKRMILADKQLVSKLPIISRKRQIFQKLDKNNLLILEGQTGSGKSTQLPQMLCEYYKIFENQKALPVLITQPRKLATRSLAERVANQMEEKIHGFVDYQTSLTSKINQNSKIVFKMDRLVLDQLKIDPTLSKYCCLVIDEAHQRTISIDVILGLIKNLLTLRNDFKVIVTSASMDIELFKRYYKTDVLKVSGRMFPVQQIFEPCSHQKDITRKIIRVFDQKILDDTSRNLRKQFRGHVLVFCSGVDQINQLVDYYSKKLNPRVFKVFALHGKLSPDQQREVFASCQQFKIIFSSRIAETSITIDGVKVVIDPGQDREMVYDQKSKVTSLKLKQISQSSAKQRAGRAGRTNEGFCFRLYSKQDKNKLSINKVPQIQNMALDSVVLRLKSLQIQDIINFPYLSAPNKQGLLNSIEVMKMLNCLNESTGKITTIGDFLVKIPIQPFLARAIVEAMLMQKVLSNKKDVIDRLIMDDQQVDKLMQFDLVEEVIRILCMIVNSTNLFYIRPEEREMAEKKKFDKLSDKDGDFFFLLNIYRQYITYYRQRQNQILKRWAYEHYLSIKTLSQARQLEKEISQIIKQFSINDKNLENQMIVTQINLIKAKTVREAILSCLVSSFATNLALYSNNQQIGYTIISLETPTQLYGTSTLSLQGISPKWILFYDLYQNEKGQMYCKIANSIDFKFLIDNTNKYIIKKYNIRDAQKFDPFYQKIVKQVPSLIFLDFLFDYQRRFYDNSNQCEFLKKFYVNFYEDLNRLQIFYKVKDFNYNPNWQTNSIMKTLKQSMSKYINNKDFRQKDNPKQIIDGYLKEIQGKYNKPLKYNYVGPIYINLKDGFQLANIDFKTIEHIYRVLVSGEAATYFYTYCSPFGVSEVYSDAIVFRITEQDDRKYFEYTLQRLIQNFRIQGINIKYKHEIQDRRRKVPQAKLFMHFWAGQDSKNNILLNYNGIQPAVNIQEMLDCLNDGSSRLAIQRNRGENMLYGISWKLTKKGNGINCFKRGTPIDQIQLHQILQEYHKNRYFGYNFVMPRCIQKFRDPDIGLATQKESDWEKQIINLLKQNGVSEQKVAVRVWGRQYYSKDKKTSALQKMMKIELHAEIKSFDLYQLLKFKERYDKKHNVIGSQKVHLKFQYEQIITVTTLKVFQALKDEYEDIVQFQQLANPKISIEYFNKTFRKLTKVYIKIRGQNRDELIKPSFRVNKLFIPKIIPLIEAKFRFIDKLEQGNEILSNIQAKYHYAIYFALDRKNFTLKLYCDDKIYRQIIQQLNEGLNKFKCFEEQICYRGKNLHKVKQILEQKIQEIKNGKDSARLLNYDVIFKYRKIRIIADILTFDQTKNSLMKIVNKQKSECEICCDLIQKPFKLSVCLHQFCWSCLSSYIRESINNLTAQLLKCPGCDKLINVFDVRRIMSQQQFNKLCDIQISRYVERDPKFHGCKSPNCENIFLSQESKRNGHFECQLCGKWYCDKCKQSHKGYNCEDFKNYKLTDDKLQSLGIKKCPGCGEGIQKNEGCQHMQCAKCKIHICWKCMKTFKQQKPCYDHLAKQCGGIFAPRGPLII